MTGVRFIRALERALFTHRRLWLGLFAVLTLVMVWFAAQLKIDAGFEKLLPLEHEYMQTFVKHRQEFGGANRVLIALRATEGDIFTPQFFESLKGVTDAVFYLPGIDRAQVKSLFTPNVRFIEIVKDGFSGGNVVPAGFQPTPEGLEQVRTNIIKAGEVGRLVSRDFSSAVVSAQLLETDPQTGVKLNYTRVADELERIRDKYAANGTDIQVHIIGFAKIVGDISDGARSVLLFFIAAFATTALLVYLYSLSIRLTLLPLVCSLVAVVWQLGLLTLLGFGIDPMSILVPFLVFAIGVSHGVQMINGVRSEVFLGHNSQTAARRAFRRLLVPGGVALISDTIGFLTLLLINIGIIRETAIAASLGVAVIILTNLFLLPILLSSVDLDEPYRRSVLHRAAALNPLWDTLSRFATRRWATGVLAVCAVLLVFGGWQSTQVRIGDRHAGVPELRPDSRYNRDSQEITQRFDLGVDILSVIVETHPDACIDYEIMTSIDDFSWHMYNIEGVHSVISLPMVAKIINAGWNEGNPKWRVLPRHPQVLSQAISPVSTSTGLLNSDCSVMPVLLFLRDHRAETIERIVAAVKSYRSQAANKDVRFRLAGGNVGVMAATNEAVAAAQFPILLYVYGAIILLCLLTFRSWRATVCIVAPLALVSMLAYALMNALEIGLKVYTLPVVALGVGIGVDYGIYIFSRFRERMQQDASIYEAYAMTLRITGNAVFFTGFSLAIGVFTWLFSDLQFQADMGKLLTFMLLLNMLGAVIVLPALAAWLYRMPEKEESSV
ncbi:MAG: MMPL family transporter [Gammaproteobacteria bacterium]|nr:MMPL family transporter [Gammaproteobacteria bacterium]